MNYLKSIADALSATTFNFRRSPIAPRRPMTLSQTELRQIVAEALG
jgi:hypothetical protein